MSGFAAGCIGGGESPSLIVEDVSLEQANGALLVRVLVSNSGSAVGDTTAKGRLQYNGNEIGTKEKEMSINPSSQSEAVFTFESHSEDRSIENYTASGKISNSDWVTADG